ncbi:MAG: fatty acid desaturase [Wenzhouxiangellaceae bacterium]
MNTTQHTARPPLERANTFFFALTNALALTIVPAWGWAVGYSTLAWVAAVVLLALGGMSITIGYHRMWAHRAFKARLPVRIVLAVFGAMALQNSILVWAARHRIHHRHVDDVERDPHSIRSGFWHAHIGWMLRAWPTSRVDFDQVPDLKRDPVVMWQHRHYWLLVWATNLGIPVALGLLTGELVGMVLLAGVLRLVVSHHFTFAINSLAHSWGWRPYSEANTAVDNPLVALVTWGEGYHNFHHAFQNDYRNGIRWWHWDPTKWVINLLAWVGLVHDRRRVPDFRIQRARLMVEFARLERRLEGAPGSESWREQIEREYQLFRETVSQWQAIQRERMERGAERMRARWRSIQWRTSMREVEFRLRMQRKRLRALMASLRTQPAGASC